MPGAGMELRLRNGMRTISENPATPALLRFLTQPPGKADIDSLHNPTSRGLTATLHTQSRCGSLDLSESES